MSKPWIRHRDKDKRFHFDDDFAGDAWRHIDTGEIRYTVVGREIDQTTPTVLEQKADADG